MTFRELITETRRAFHHSGDYFGERVRYTSANGVPRMINVHITVEEDLTIEGDDTETRMDTLQVKCERDDCVGIALPNLGDTIERFPPNDRNPAPYVYAGEYASESSDAWKLKFHRHRRDAQGFTK